MRLLPLATLIIAGAAVVGCGTTRDNRYNETAYADHNGPYGHDVAYRSAGYNDRYYYDDDGRIVYVRPSYRVVPVEPHRVIYGDDGYYYYRD
ncbi:MAG TPA: hypothetical protein VGF43_01195 [Dongiaceae bacterium]|jgi:hypothetical protein